MKNKFMDIALEEAKNGVLNNEGGPFGAVIVDKNDNIISKGHNMVLKNNDPTAHAEIVAIRNACSKLNTIDLKEYILYTTCEPCPMCLSAIIWSNIKEVYYACTKKDADNIGFRDDLIYEYIKGNNKIINMQKMDKDECLDLMNKYKNDKKEMY